MDNKVPAVGERLYTGDGKNHYTPLDGAWEEEEPYFAPQSLVNAVNAALYLRRPLLLEGDPGCGKTRLAYAVAYELGLPLKCCYIQSTSRARDLLYTFDSVRRLYDIEENRRSYSHKKELPKKDYITLGELGEAIEYSMKDIPSVVLIDEIDKADIDFPNDLLRVLEDWRFEADEVKGYQLDALKGQPKEKRKGCLPLVIITSNREKELPKPFLRRCLYYFIEFPKEKELGDIIKKHKDGKELTDLFQAALSRFWKLRNETRLQWRKKPSTSELMDWIDLLENDQRENQVTVEQIQNDPISKLPHRETLVKMQADLEAVQKLEA